jgi:hypothetical protein
MDLESGEISPDFLGLYREVRQEMADELGIAFKYPSLYA